MFGIFSKAGLSVTSQSIAKPLSSGYPVFMLQKSFFSKYLSNSKTKRLPLSTKKVGGSYYKGNRCRKEGVITSKGSLYCIIMHYFIRYFAEILFFYDV